MGRKNVESLRQRELEHSRVVDPKAMPEGCAFSPLVQLTMRDMRRKKYLQKIHTPYETLEKKMTATFETTPNGAVQISVGYMTSKHNRNIVRQLVVEKDSGKKKAHKHKSTSPVTGGVS